MKALTVRQPWANLIALGVKTIETRSWKAPDKLIGERIAIHAGADERSLSYLLWEEDHIGETPEVLLPIRSRLDFGYTRTGLVRAIHDLHLGSVIATATLSGCWQMTDGFDWATMPERGVLDLGDHPETGVANALTLYGKGDNEAIDLLDFTDDRPYGHYAPGRWAWYLTDVEQIDPVPAKGRLGLWEWSS